MKTTNLPVNIIIEPIAITYCHAVERAIEKLLKLKIRPTTLLIGAAPDIKNQEYVDSMCKEKKILLLTKLIRSLRPNEIILIGDFRDVKEI